MGVRPDQKCRPGYLELPHTSHQNRFLVQPCRLKKSIGAMRRFAVSNQSMRRFLCFLPVVLAAGCGSPKSAGKTSEAGWPRMDSADLARPSNPETVGWTRQTAPSGAESARLEVDARAAFTTVFDGKLPKNFSLESAPMAWLNPKGELKQLRAVADIPRATFRAAFPRDKWAEVPVPPDYLQLMRLAPGTPANEMTCFAGRVNTKPAYVFWSEYAETAMLVLDY